MSTLKEEKKQKKLNALLEAFNNNEYLSFDDIKSILNCGKTVAIDYLNLVKGRCTLETKKINGFKYYRAIFNDDIQNYTKLSKQDVTLFDTLQTVQYFSKTKSNTKETYELSFDPSYGKLIDYSLTKFYENVNILIDKGLISKDKDKNLHIKSSENYRISLTINDLKKYSIKLNNLVPTNRYFNQLHSIQNKINPYLGDVYDDIFVNNYHSYGKENNSFVNAANNFKKFDHINFPNYAVKITYKNKNNDITDCILYTGFITYVEEKDTIYIVGKELNNDKLYPVIIADSIINIEQTELYNYCYLNGEFKDIYNQMFSISTSEPYKVEVVFDNIFNIFNKLKRLSSKRKETSSIKIMNNKIYYTDTIRGLHDFATYLRRYGKSCKVVKPEELIEIMNNSIKRTLDEYEKLRREENTNNE